MPLTLPSNELSTREVVAARPNGLAIFGNLTLQFCKSLEVPNPSYVQGTQLLTYYLHACSLTRSSIM